MYYNIYNMSRIFKEFLPVYNEKTNHSKKIRGKNKLETTTNVWTPRGESGLGDFELGDWVDIYTLICIK